MANVTLQKPSRIPKTAGLKPRKITLETSGTAKA